MPARVLQPHSDGDIDGIVLGACHGGGQSPPGITGSKTAEVKCEEPAQSNAFSGLNHYCWTIVLLDRRFGELNVGEANFFVA